ncbi:MAG: hypothetical protein ACLPSF_11310 [Methylocella sp.]
MRLQKTAAKLAVIMALAFAFAAPAAASASQPAAGAHRRPAGDHRHGRVSYAETPARADAPSRFLDLPRDGWSGPSFRSPPQPYRTDARRRRVIEYARERNAIGAAIARDAVSYDFDRDHGYAFGNSHSVFNPVEGVGTPFFGGYYN